MKKIILLLVSIVTLMGISHKAYSMSFTEGYKNVNSKPLLIYVTAPWIDNASTYNSVYQQAEKNLSSLYNVVTLNVATSDLKIFNESFQIYPNLPYVLLFKNGTKISRYLQKDCIKDYACLDGRAKSFLH